MFVRSLRPNLYDYVKIVAIGLMIVDHVWYFLFPDVYWLRLIGRLAMPSFLFLVGLNGFYGWSSWLWRWAIATQMCWSLYFWAMWRDVRVVQILGVIVLMRILLSVAERIRLFSWVVWVVFLILLFVWLFVFHHRLALVVDYGSYAFLRWLVWYVCSRFVSGVWSFPVIVWLCIPFLMYQYDVFGGIFQSLWWSWVALWLLAWSVVLWRIAWRNDSLLTGLSSWDRFVVWLSRQALRVYVYHVVFLVGMSLVLYVL